MTVNVPAPRNRADQVALGADRGEVGGADVLAHERRELSRVPTTTAPSGTPSRRLDCTGTGWSEQPAQAPDQLVARRVQAGLLELLGRTPASMLRFAVWR